MRSAYNELKVCLLSVLREQEELDSRATAVGAASLLSRHVSLRSIEMALLRYHRQGLLGRSGKRGAYMYRLSDKGIRRLEWLHNQRSGATRPAA
ncbi:MAG: hypothetical protein V1857_06100 [archaeon]